MNTISQIGTDVEEMTPPETAATAPVDMPDETTKQAAGFRQYWAMIRPDEWVKNIFIGPGILFAGAVYQPALSPELFVNIVLGMISACLAASANYVINEYLDAEFDQYHPIKKHRSSVIRVVSPKVVGVLYFVLATISITLGQFISQDFLITIIFLLVMGILYNVRPFRTKERVFLDVLSESVNNPIRFALGWFMITAAVWIPLSHRSSTEFWYAIPPLSITIAYWMGGAFLMATKRFAEYRLINDPKIAGLYRKSFQYYTENSLLISMFFYGITCAFFMGIFLVKNRIEMLLSFPFFALLFAWYLKIGLLKNSPVQGYEKLYTRKWFMLYLVLFTALLCGLMFIDIPWLKWFLSKSTSLG